VLTYPVRLLVLALAIGLLTLPSFAKDRKAPRAKDGTRFSAIYNGKQNMPVTLYGVSRDWANQCAGGNGDMCFKLGDAFETGLGDFLPDPAIAIGYYISACDNDHILGCGKATQYLLMGNAGFKNEDLATDKGIYACNELDAPDACAWLAYAKYEGIGGMAHDPEGARDLWGWTCLNGSDDGCRMYANYYWKNDPSEDGQVEAIAVFQEHCNEHKKAWACLGYGLMIEDTPFIDFTDEERAEGVLEIRWGCLYGEGDRIPACAEYGKRKIRDTHDEGHINFAEGVLDNACSAGIAESCFLIGQHGIDGEVHDGEVTRGEAGYYLRRACDLDYGDACMALATAYENGSMRKVRENVASILKEKACRLGNQQACAWYNDGANDVLVAALKGFMIDPSLPAAVQLEQAMELAESEPNKTFDTVALLMEEQYPDAEWLLGNWFLTGKPGIVDTPNLQNAVTLFENAAVVGHIEAAKWMGMAHWDGLHGVEFNRERGQAYMSIAAAQYDEEAVMYYRSMLYQPERDRRAREAAAAAAEAEERESNWFARWAESISYQSSSYSSPSGPSASARLAADAWQRSQTKLDNLLFQQRIDYLTGATTACNRSNPYC